MGRGTQNASIILLLGTSTAGKSTICQAIIEENFKLAPKVTDDPMASKLDMSFVGVLPAQQMEWKVDGDDLMSDRLNVFGKIMTRCHQELKDDPRLQKIQELQPRFLEIEAPKKGVMPAAAELYRAISMGKLAIHNQSLNLLDKSEFDKEIGKFLEAAEGGYSREILEELQSLAIDKHKIIYSAVDEVVKQNNVREKLFDQAIENSKNGKPTILDVVPGGDDIIQQFTNYLKAKNHQCPINIVLVHLPVSELSGRMRERNAKAVEKGDDADVRNQFFPFVQYGHIWEPQKEGDGKRVVGALTEKDLDSAFAAFGKTGSDDKDMSELKIKFGFLPASQSENQEVQSRTSVPIVAISPNFDVVYDTSSKKSTLEIAKKIIASSTDQSLTPSIPNPGVSVAALQASPLFQRVQKAHSK